MVFSSWGWTVMMRGLSVRGVDGRLVLPDVEAYRMIHVTREPIPSGQLGEEWSENVEIRHPKVSVSAVEPPCSADLKQK